MAKQYGNQLVNGVMGGVRRLSGWAMPKAKPFQEMGASGTAVWGGFIQNREKSPQWVGQQKYVTSQDLATNISIIAAGVHYFLNLIAHPNWTVRPSDDENPESVRLAEWVEDVLLSCDTPWYRIVRKGGMYRFHGFGIQEWTAIKRSDGSIGFKDVEARPQHTIRQWDTDSDGNILGVWQRNPQTGQLLGIPRGKMLYLVDDTLTDSPEGIGMFRHMADPYNRIKRLFELELRAYERDMRGIPIGRAPLTALNQAVKANAITQAQATAMVDSIKNLIKTEVQGSSTGVLLDSQAYTNTTVGGPTISSVQQWGFDLLQGPGKGFTEISAAIDRTQREMARIIGVEHLMLGDHGGNRALSQDKSRNLYLIANSVLSNIATQAEHDLLMPLWSLNGFDADLMPTLETEDVTFKDVDSVSGTLQKMAQAGAVLAPNDPVIDDVRDLLGVSRTPEQTNEQDLGDSQSFDESTSSDGSAGIDPDTQRPPSDNADGGYSGQPSALTAKGVGKGGRRPFVGWGKVVKSIDQQAKPIKNPIWPGNHPGEVEDDWPGEHSAALPLGTRLAGDKKPKPSRKSPTAGWAKRNAHKYNADVNPTAQIDNEGMLPPPVPTKKPKMRRHKKRLGGYKISR